MVKLGGVRNYVVGTWSAPDLVACAAMNLPCADLSPWLPEPMNGDATSDQYMSHDYLVRLCLPAVDWAAPLPGAVQRGSTGCAAASVGSECAQACCGMPGSRTRLPAAALCLAARRSLAGCAPRSSSTCCSWAMWCT